MKKTLTTMFILPILAGTLLFTGCGQTRAEREKLEQQVDEKVKRYLSRHQVQNKETPKEKSLDSYFFQGQELSPLAPLKGMISEEESKFENLKIFDSDHLNESGLGEWATKNAKSTGQAEYFLPSGKKLHLIAIEYNSQELAKAMEEKINPEQCAGPRFTFRNKNFFIYINHPNVPTFVSSDMMPDEDKKVLSEILPLYAKRIEAKTNYLLDETGEIKTNIQE